MPRITRRYALANVQAETLRHDTVAASQAVGRLLRQWHHPAESALAAYLVVEAGVLVVVLVVLVVMVTVAEVGASVGPSVGATVGASMGSLLGASVGATVGPGVGVMVGAAESDYSPQWQIWPRSRRREC